jgi:two-component system response regulator NreC
VLVLDLHMPDGSALHAIRTVAERPDTTRGVVLTMDNDPSVARAALRAGALGFVVKEAADDELLAAIRSAARGEAYLSPRIAARIAAPAPEPSGLPDDLTERELEVLRLVVLGFTSPEIGRQLHVSGRTVESHRTHIQQKTRRSSRAELVRYAITNRLLDVGAPPTRWP